MQEEWDFNIVVVGLGLIGASFAMALKKLQPRRIWGVDINPAVIEKAERMGIIDQGYTEAGEPLKNADLVILAVYPENTIRFVKEHMDDFKAGTLITDTAGIKGKIMAEIIPVLREDLDFVGGHPMAGREGAGIEMASPEIFQGAGYIITPVSRNRPAGIALVEKMARAIGCAHIRHLSPEGHDEVISYVSQLPHVMAVSLVNCNSGDIDPRVYCGGSFRDATRVALINAPLWTELLLDNRESILRQISCLENQLTQIKTALVQGNGEILRNIIEKADSGRRKMSHA